MRYRAASAVRSPRLRLLSVSHRSGISVNEMDRAASMKKEDGEDKAKVVNNCTMADRGNCTCVIKRNPGVVRQLAASLKKDEDEDRAKVVKNSTESVYEYYSDEYSDALYYSSDDEPAAMVGKSCNEARIIELRERLLLKTSTLPCPTGLPVILSPNASTPLAISDARSDRSSLLSTEPLIVEVDQNAKVCTSMEISELVSEADWGENDFTEAAVSPVAEAGELIPVMPAEAAVSPVTEAGELIPVMPTKRMAPPAKEIREEVPCCLKWMQKQMNSEDIARLPLICSDETPVL